MNWLDPILRPLARLAIARGWLFPAMSERLRIAYLAEAQTTSDGAATDSRLSVMTGLQRRDIARLRSEDQTAPKPQRQPLAEIIAAWVEDPTYPETGLDILGDGVSFATLARSVRKDVHPRTFLDMLIQAGTVQEAEGKVSLIMRAYVPLHGSDDQLSYLAANVGDHFSTAVDNVTIGSDQFEVSAHYQGLSSDAIAQLDARWRAKMVEALEDINAAARAMPKSQNGTLRFRAGAYFHKEDTK